MCLVNSISRQRYITFQFEEIMSNLDECDKKSVSRSRKSLDDIRRFRGPPQNFFFDSFITCLMLGEDHDWAKIQNYILVTFYYQVNLS